MKNNEAIEAIESQISKLEWEIDAGYFIEMAEIRVRQKELEQKRNEKDTLKRELERIVKLLKEEARS